MVSLFLSHIINISSTVEESQDILAQLHDISWQYLQCKKKKFTESSNVRRARKNECLDIIRAFMRA